MAKRQRTREYIIPLPKGDNVKESNSLAIAGLYPTPLSVFELRIYQKCVSMIKQVQAEYNTPEKLKDFPGFPPMSFMAGVLLYNQKKSVAGRDLIRIKASCKNLIQAYFSKYISPSKFAFYTVFTSIKYDTGIITFQLNNDLIADLLLVEKQFTLRGNNDFNQLTSVHAQFLYKAILVQARYKTQFEFSVPELHNLLCATEAYKRQYGVFKDRVLNPALKHIKERIPELQYITIDEKKVGKKVVGITFDVFGDRKQDLPKSATPRPEHDYQKESRDCFIKHGGNECKPRKCKKCQFCYERGSRTFQIPPAWLFPHKEKTA